MRIPSGSTDRKIGFTAVDSNGARLTGLSSFTVYRSRNGGAATAYTTPTVAELDATNMPGDYVLTIDEDTTVDSGHDYEPYLVHISAAGMQRVTRELELVRVKFTEGQSATMANSAVDADVERWQGTVPNALVAGRVDSRVGAWATDVVTAAALAADAVAEIRAPTSGTADGGTTSTLVDSALTQGTVDYWKGMVLVMTSGANAGLGRLITGFNPGTDTLTITPAFTAIISSGDAYEIWPQGRVDLHMWKGAVPQDLTVDLVKCDAQAIGTNAINSAAIANDAITAAKIATGAIDADAVAADAVAEIQAGLATSAALAAVQADTDDIQTRLPAALVGGRMDSSVGAMATDVVNAAALAADAVAEIQAGLATSAALAAVQADTDDIQAKIGTPAGASLSADVAAVQADTDNIQTRLPAALVGGRMDSSVGAMAADVVNAAALAADAVAEIQAGLATPASVNAEVLDVLAVDTFAQPGQEAPAAVTTLQKMLAYLYKGFRNRITESATLFKLHADDGTTVDQKATVSDDGTTFDRGELGSGP